MPKYWSEVRPEVTGFDTETCLGNLLLVCSSNGDSLEPRNTEDALEFLWRTATDYNFFYNIQFDFSVLIKDYLVDSDFDEEFRESKKLVVGDLKVKYVPNKGFILSKKGQKRKMFFDISNFYKDREGKSDLQTVATSFLGLGKLEDVDRQELGENPAYYPSHREEVVKYCIRDASLTCQLADKFIEGIKETFGFYPVFYYSQASVSKGFLERNYPEIRNWFFKMPFSQANFIYKTYMGGVFDTKFLGFFAETSQIDINSAYPYAISQLPDLEGSHTVENEWLILGSKEILAGFYEILVQFDGFLPYRTKRQGIIYPVSVNKLPFYCTNFELKYLMKRGIKFNRVKSLEIIGKFTPKFRKFEEIYAERQAIKGEMKGIIDFIRKKSLEIRDWNLKLVLNASYGCLAESRNGMTPFTNFVYSALITARTRVKLWEMSDYLGWERVIQLATDGLLVKGRVEIDSKKFGDWSQKFVSKPIIVFGNGVSESKLEGETRKRGFTALTPEILAQGKGSEIVIKRKRPLRLMPAIIQHRLQDIGKFEEEERTFDLQSNLLKRIYPLDSLTFEFLRGETVEGKPHIVSEPMETKDLDKKRFDWLQKWALNSLRK